MKEASLKTIADLVVRSKDPVTTGRQVLVDAYSRTGGLGETDIRKAAVFELVRSRIIQSVYEATEGQSVFVKWPHNMILNNELDEAVQARTAYLCSGMRGFLAGKFPQQNGSKLNTIRMALDVEANQVERFLGSTRRYVPGVGYAVSIRKRHAPNQDSYLLGRSDGAALMGVADGCGSQVFSSLASHMSLQRAMESGGMFLQDPKKTICGISSEIATIVNTKEMTDAFDGHGGGTSTLLIGISRENERSVFRVGDSIGFRVFKLNGSGPRVEVLKIVDGLEHVMGQWNPLHADQVEQHSRGNGQLVLTSDGVTNFIGNTAGFILGLAQKTSNCVLMAERIAREALKGQIDKNEADDVTVIVQETN